LSCVLRQAARRASSGWVDVVVVDGPVVEVASEAEEERRVSKRPGAEGAPWLAGAVVLVGCAAGGAMRSDCVREGENG
jgi:hypothetical protein